MSPVLYCRIGVFLKGWGMGLYVESLIYIARVPFKF
jgi:hypothetical protein